MVHFWCLPHPYLFCRHSCHHTFLAHTPWISQVPLVMVSSKGKSAETFTQFLLPESNEALYSSFPKLQSMAKKYHIFPAPFVSCVITFQLNRLFMANYPQNLDVHCAPKIYLLIRHLRCFEAYFINNFNILTIWLAKVQIYAQHIIREEP